MASNTSPSWQEPARLDVEVADVAQGPAAREARVAERRQRVQRLSSQQLPHLKAEPMFLRRRPRLWPITIRDCLFTLFRIENSIAFSPHFKGHFPFGIGRPKRTSNVPVKPVLSTT